MHINQLKYLLAISQSPSLNSAAELLHITPQSLGAAMKTLEKELGVTLLTRSPQGSVLTTQAQELTDIAQRFLNELDQFVLHSHAACGDVNIAASNDSFYGFLPFVLQNLYQIAPALKISVKHMLTEDVIAHIQNHNADVGFIFQTFSASAPQFILPDTFTAFPIMDYQLVCQAISRYPFTKHKTTTFASLLDYPLVIAVTNNDLNSSLYFIIKHYTHSKNITLEYSIPVYRAMIRSGLGVGFSIKHAYADQISTYIPDLPSVIITEDVKIQLFCIFDHTAPLSPAAQFFIEHLRSHILL